jgi:lipid-binding SYLF domain-containing protein
LFAGVFLDGSTLRPDNDANQRLYNRSVTAKEIVLDGMASPPLEAAELLSELNER